MSSTIISQTSIPVFSAVRHQPVGPKSAAARRRHVRQVAMLAALGVIMALLYVWIRIQVIHLGYEVSKIRKETQELSEQKGLLKAEVETLKAPMRIESVAREKFGMRLPQTDEVVIIEPAQTKQEEGGRKQEEGSENMH